MVAATAAVIAAGVAVAGVGLAAYSASNSGGGGSSGAGGGGSGFSGFTAMNKSDPNSASQTPLQNKDSVAATTYDPQEQLQRWTKLLTTQGDPNASKS